MKKATAKLFLDTSHPKKNGKCAVKVKITFNRKRKYYPVNLDMTLEEFEKVTTAQRITKAIEKQRTQLDYVLNKAESIINQLHKKLDLFTFDLFEESFYENRDTINSVSFAFDKYIKELKEQQRIGTAVSYECARNSLESFKKNSTFADITVNFLEKYEKWMLTNEKSISTVGIYLRSLRTIYNKQKIDKSLYPFGEGKYAIPKGKNIKKALTIEEVGLIYNHPIEPNTTKEMARDYWIFMYLCNGMNVKDLCLLKRTNIEGEWLHYEREKTKRSKKESNKISVSLKPQTKNIISKWSKRSLVDDDYLFPHLSKKMTPERERRVYQQLTKTINKYLKQIALELDINKPVTSYYARHSFATVLKRSGSSTEMISELLGHSNVNVTKSYLDSFEEEQIKTETDSLTIGF